MSVGNWKEWSAALAVVAMCAAGVVYAQGPGGRSGGPGGFGGPGGPGFGGPGGPGGLPLRELNLTETQQQQVRDVIQQYRDQNQKAAEALRTATEAQRTAVRTMPINEGLIRSTTQALAEAQTEMAIQQARMQNDIFQLLTPAQQEQVQKLQAERQQNVQQRRRGPKGQPPQQQ
jgi:Spy/CpxP family protein refolding chaperone